MNQRRIQSLKGEHAFANVFKSSRKLRDPLLNVYVQFGAATSPDSSCSFLGVVVRKKIVRRAVDRNRIKRWVRMAVRVCAKEHKDTLSSVGAIVVVWQMPYSTHKADVSFQQVYDAIVRALERANMSGARR